MAGDRDKDSTADTAAMVPAGPDPEPQFKPEVLEKFVDNQTRELEVRARELQLLEIEKTHAHEFALKSLDAQVQDRKAEREYHRLSLRYGSVFFTAILASVVGVVVYAMHGGFKDIAVEIVKAIGLVLAGGLGGYGVGRTQAKGGAKDG
jgi:hypothetical protein